MNKFLFFIIIAFVAIVFLSVPLSLVITQSRDVLDFKDSNPYNFNIEVFDFYQGYEFENFQIVFDNRPQSYQSFTVPLTQIYDYENSICLVNRVVSTRGACCKARGDVDKGDYCTGGGCTEWCYKYVSVDANLSQVTVLTENTMFDFDSDRWILRDYSDFINGVCYGTQECDIPVRVYSSTSGSVEVWINYSVVSVEPYNPDEPDEPEGSDIPEVEIDVPSNNALVDFFVRIWDFIKKLFGVG